MNTILNSPVALGLVTMLCLALATPFIRAGLMSGATVAAMSAGYAIPFVLLVFFEKPGGIPDLGSARGILFAAVAGFFVCIGTRISFSAYALPGGHASIVAAIIGAFPVAVVVLSAIFFGEAHKVRIPAVVLGSILTASGVVITALYGMKQ